MDTRTKKGRKVTIRKVEFYRAKAWGERTPNVFEDAVDMLRYDSAFATTADPSLVCFVTFYVGGQGLVRSFTPDRWRSFGITLEPVLEPIEFGLHSLRGEEWIKVYQNHSFRGWVTLRHPKDDDGRTDFEAYEEITIEERMEQLGRTP